MRLYFCFFLLRVLRRTLCFAHFDPMEAEFYQVVAVLDLRWLHQKEQDEVCCGCMCVLLPLRSMNFPERVVMSFFVYRVHVSCCPLHEYVRMVGIWFCAVVVVDACACLWGFIVVDYI